MDDDRDSDGARVLRRNDRVGAVVTGPATPEPRPADFWVTRVTEPPTATFLGGEVIDVWTARPDMIDGRWTGRSHHSRHWVANPPAWVRTLPDDHRMCVFHQGYGPLVPVRAE